MNWQEVFLCPVNELQDYRILDTCIISTIILLAEFQPSAKHDHDKLNRYLADTCLSA